MELAGGKVNVTTGTNEANSSSAAVCGTKRPVNGGGVRLSPHISAMKNFFRYAKLSLFLQGVVWLVILVVGFATSPWPALESVLEVFIRFYYPTVVIVVKLGIFKGEQNITAPILLGVPLGIFLYSILFGVIASYYKAYRHLDKIGRND